MLQKISNLKRKLCLSYLFLFLQNTPKSYIVYTIHNNKDYLGKIRESC